MVLDHFSFFKKNYQSAASRNAFHFNSEWALRSHHRFNKLLSTRVVSKSGRNKSGQIVIRTKTSFLVKKKSIKINYTFRCKRMGSILAFQFLPFKNKVLSLIFFNNGSFSYYLATESHKLFSYFYATPIKTKKLKKYKLKTIFFMLFQIKKLSFVSCLELTPGLGAQYIRSTGVKGRLLRLDRPSHTALVELPSKIKKVFSYYSFGLLNGIALNLHKKCYNGKFGYWRTYGNKQTVRGVAMNAVDHPNGGRTKSLKYSKTPWGKTTKFK